MYDKKGNAIFEGKNTFDKSSYSLYRRFTICLVDDLGYLKILIRNKNGE